MTVREVIKELQKFDPDLDLRRYEEYECPCILSRWEHIYDIDYQYEEDYEGEIIAEYIGLK